MSVARRLYDIVRSRLPRRKEICLHSWQTIDYFEEVTPYDVTDYYTIGCPKCNKTRTVDKYTHKTMKKEGLLI